MKKQLLFVLAAMSVTGLSAERQSAAINVGNPLCCHELLSSSADTRIDGMPRQMNAPDNRREDLQGEPIYDRPEGRSTEYLRESVGFHVMAGSWQFGKVKNLSTIVYTDDGKAYIHNPFGGWQTNSYLECDIIGDRLVASLPQPIYQQASAITGEPTDFFISMVYRVDTSNGKLSYEMPSDGEKQEVSFIIKEDGKICLDLDLGEEYEGNGYPDALLAMVMSDGSWVTAGDCMQTYSESNLSLVETPDNLELQDWLLLSSSSSGGSIRVGVGFDGNDVYVNNLCTSLPNSFVKGEVRGDKIAFQTGQFVGEYSSNLTFFIGGTYEADGSYELLDEIVFDYDRDNGRITIDAGHFIAYSISTENLIYISIFLDPNLKMANPDPNPVPEAPVPLLFADYFDAYNYSILYADFPMLNAEGDLLNTENMYYKVFIDGEPFVFAAEDYALEEDMENIPYDFTTNGGILKINESQRYLYFYFTGFDTIGLQLFNVREGVTYSSPLVTYDVEEGTVTGLDTIECGDRGSAEYYSAAGIRLSRPAKGLNIVRTKSSDGTVKTEKVFVR